MARKTIQQQRIERLVAKQEKAIADAFRVAMAKAGNAIDRAALIRFLEAGDVERAVQLFRIERGVLFPLEEAVRNAFIAGGLSVADDLPKGLTGAFGFDGGHPRAAKWAQSKAAELVTYTSDENIAAARRVITEGLESNRGLQSVARDLAGRKVGKRRVGGIVGLTEQQTERMMRLRSMLRDPDQIGDYFKGNGPRYRESDRRFDAMVRRAIRDGKALSAADIDKVAEAYKSKATKARAERVARTEAFTAQASGRDEAYQQVMGRDDVETVTVRWQHNLSQNPRDDHQAMDGTVITLGEDFVFPDGTRMKHPHDLRGGAEHSVGCKCTAFHRVRLARD